MTRTAKKEIRRVLLGRTQVGENGRLVPLEPGAYRIPVGIGDGAGAVRFLGITRRGKRLETQLPRARALDLARQTMKDVGRGLDLREQPEAAACLIRYVLTRPVVLVFDYPDEGGPCLTAWTGRGATGWISLRRALNAFLKRMPKGFAVSETPLPEDESEKKDKKRKLTRKEKKQAKARKKEARRGRKGGQAPAEAVNKEETE